MVRHLAQTTGDAGAIVVGMIQSVETSGTGTETIINFAGSLLNKWLMYNDQVLTIRPGFVMSIFTFLYLCGDRQHETYGHRIALASDLDRQLLPIVRAALPWETWKTINATGKYAATSIHWAAGFLLPKITLALLQHGAINVNLRNQWGWSPLVVLVVPDHWMSDSRLQVASILLSFDKTNTSLRDHDKQTAMSYCLKHLSHPESQPLATLEMVKNRWYSTRV